MAWSVPPGLEGTQIDVARYRHSDLVGSARQWPHSRNSLILEPNDGALFFVRSAELPEIGSVRVLPSDDFLKAPGGPEEVAADQLRQRLASLHAQSLDPNYTLPNPDHLGWTYATVAGKGFGKRNSERVYWLHLVDVVAPAGVSLPDSIRVRFTGNYRDASTPLYSCGVPPVVKLNDRIRLSLCDGGGGDYYGCDDGWGVLTLSPASDRGTEEERVWRGYRLVE